MNPCESANLELLLETELHKTFFWWMIMKVESLHSTDNLYLIIFKTIFNIYHKSGKVVVVDSREKSIPN